MDGQLQPRRPHGRQGVFRQLLAYPGVGVAGGADLEMYCAPSWLTRPSHAHYLGHALCSALSHRYLHAMAYACGPQRYGLQHPRPVVCLARMQGNAQPGLAGDVDGAAVQAGR
jgi:hypothetical protein